MRARGRAVRCAAELLPAPADQAPPGGEGVLVLPPPRAGGAARGAGSGAAPRPGRGRCSAGGCCLLPGAVVTAPCFGQGEAEKPRGRLNEQPERAPRDERPGRPQAGARTLARGWGPRPCPRGAALSRGRAPRDRCPSGDSGLRHFEGRAAPCGRGHRRHGFPRVLLNAWYIFMPGAL